MSLLRDILSAVLMTTGAAFVLLAIGFSAVYLYVIVSTPDPCERDEDPA